MYRKGIEVAPPHPVDIMGLTYSAAPLWYRIGKAYSDLGDRQKAIEAFLEAGRIEPGIANTWNELGVVYMNMPPRDSRAAFVAFKKAYDIDPKHTSSLNNMGMIHAMGGSVEGVKWAYQLLLNLDKVTADKFLQQAKWYLDRPA